MYKHWPAKTVTEADDHLFCLLTMNHHPLHINDVYAAESQQGRNVVVGPLVYSLALGMSVADVSGKAIANLATEELSHPAPVFHGDTLFAESEVLEVRPSQSKPDRGIVKVHTRVHKQDGTLVAEFKRAVLVPRRLMLLRLLYWLAVVAISVALVVALILWFESQDASDIENTQAPTPVTTAA